MAALNKCIFGKKSVGSEILAFGSHCSANFLLILDCSVPTPLKVKVLGFRTICIDTVIFNLHQIKERNFLGGHPVGLD